MLSKDEKSAEDLSQNSCKSKFIEYDVHRYRALLISIVKTEFETETDSFNSLFFYLENGCAGLKNMPLDELEIWALDASKDMDILPSEIRSVGNDFRDWVLARYDK